MVEAFLKDNIPEFLKCWDKQKKIVGDNYQKGKNMFMLLKSTIQ